MTAHALPRARARRRRPLSPLGCVALLLCIEAVLIVAVGTMCFGGRDLPRGDVAAVCGDLLGVTVGAWLFSWCWPMFLAEWRRR